MPETIKAKGTILEASPAGALCGNLARGGTLKIRLDERVKGYDNDYLYVVVLCFAAEDSGNFLNKSVDLDVKKMTKYPYSFHVLLSNSIDSHGAPFFLASSDGVGGLLKKIESRQVS